MIKLIVSYLCFFTLLSGFSQNDSLRRVSTNWKSKGNFFAVQKKFTQAFDAYQKAIHIDSTNSIAYYKFYRSHLKLNNDTALYYLKKTFEYNPFLNDSLLLELSHYYLNNGDYKTSKRYLNKYNKLKETELEIPYAVRKCSESLGEGFKKRTVIFFPTDNYKHQLDQILPFLEQSKLKCSVKSYCTQDKDSYQNLAISKKRSASIKQYLMNNGVKKSSIKVINYGSSSLLVEPKDPLSSTYNNRVEIEILW